MKYWLIINLSIALLLATAQTVFAPRGTWQPVIRVVETRTGTELDTVWCWYEWKGVGP